MWVFKAWFFPENMVRDGYLGITQCRIGLSLYLKHYFANPSISTAVFVSSDFVLFDGRPELALCFAGAEP